MFNQLLLGNKLNGPGAIFCLAVFITWCRTAFSQPHRLSFSIFFLNPYNKRKNKKTCKGGHM
ncbi:hypothetical protein HMPREF1380_01602 [Enterococcus faecium R499]|nr:hypothetical protein HMPREF1380_01602 [Enterococcus faecium R499]